MPIDMPKWKPTRKSNSIFLSKLSLLLPLSLAAYIALLAIPQASNTNWFVSNSSALAASIRTYQVIAAAQFATLMLLGFSLIRPRLTFNVQAIVIWALLLSWYGLSTLWSIAPENTAFYSLLLLVLLISMVFFWACVDAQIAALFVVLSTSSSLLFLLVNLPLNGRRLGGVEPNLIAHFGLAILALSFLSQHRLRWLPAIFSIFLIVTMQARTVFVGTIIFLAIWYIGAPLTRTRAGMIRITIAMAIMAIAMIPLIIPTINFISDFSTQTLDVTDESRLGDSGFTGRQQLWENALVILNEHEMGGFGFRTRETATRAISPSANVHSGLLNAALDTGAVGLGLFLLLFGATFWNALTRWTQTHQIEDRTAISFLSAMIPILAVEPNYLNFGHPTSFLLLLFLTRYVAPRAPMNKKTSIGFSKHLLHRPQLKSIN